MVKDNGQVRSRTIGKPLVKLSFQQSDTATQKAIVAQARQLAKQDNGLSQKAMSFTNEQDKNAVIAEIDKFIIETQEKDRLWYWRLAMICLITLCVILAGNIPPLWILAIIFALFAWKGKAIAFWFDSRKKSKLVKKHNTK
jgi:hypothetical protein